MNTRPSLRRPDENPFRSEVIDGIRFRPQGITWDDLVGRLEFLGWRAAIVGREGSGKTALLEQLARRCNGRIVRLHGAERRPYPSAAGQLASAPGTEDVVFFDGVEQLGPLAWWRFNHLVRKSAGLVITSHRSGRLPTLIECRTSPTLFRELVEELAPNDIESLDPTLDDLFERHHGNIRSCFRALYDQYAGRKPKSTL
jgi:hypothetical protein